VGCYIWYSEEGPGWGRSPSSPLLAVPNVTAHPSMASVPITILLSVALRFWRAHRGLTQVKRSSCINVQVATVPSAHPSHKMLASVDNVARQARIVNARDWHSLCLVTSMPSINTDRFLFNVSKRSVARYQSRVQICEKSKTPIIAKETIRHFCLHILAYVAN